MARHPAQLIETDGVIARLELRLGLWSIIDVQDIPLVEAYCWNASIGQHGHAYAYARINNRPVPLHRFLLGAPKGAYVDHKDGDGLNNRRSNIRLCTQAQNMANKVIERRNKLGVKGVSPSGGKFRATITPNGKQIHLGSFNTVEEAAAAYRGASIALWGEFARSE